jgi:hypothetical protein
MKHCLILAPLVLSSAAAFTSVNRQFHSLVNSQTFLKAGDYDYNGTNDRIGTAYKEWCRVYQKTDTSRLEIFAYHFLLAEKFFGETGAPIKLNEYADLSSNEYLSLSGNGSLPQVAKPTTEYVVSETTATEYAMPEPVAPADYGPAGASYLEALGAGATNISGAGMTSYLDTVPKQSGRSGGAGMTSYVDAMNKASPADEQYYVPPPAAQTVYTPPAPAVSTPYTPAEPAAPVAKGGNYMDNLSRANTAGAPSGRGMTSYLDTVPANAAVGGKGMTSYVESMGAGGYTPFEMPVASAAPAAPAASAPAPYTPAEAAAPVAKGGNYMDNLSGASTAKAPSGRGMTSYLDTVPTNAAVGGAGMTSYADSMGVGTTPFESYSPFEIPVASAASAPAVSAPYIPYTPAEPAAPVANGGNYMDNLSGASNIQAPRGAGMTSYLDTVPTNAAVGGAGMASYLSNVGAAAPAEYTPFEARAAPVASTPAPYVPPVASTPEPYVPPQPYVPAQSAAPVATGGNYMDNLSGASTARAPGGRGMTSYLDTVPSNGAAAGGAGMSSYLQNMGEAQPSALDYGSPAAPPMEPAVTEFTIEPVAEEPIYVEQYETVPLPPPSRNLPATHWMDTVTPLASYGRSHWMDTVTPKASYGSVAAVREQVQPVREQVRPDPYLAQEQQVRPDPYLAQEQQAVEPAPSPQESIAPPVRQRVQVETFGGGYIVS